MRYLLYRRAWNKINIKAPEALIIALLLNHLTHFRVLKRVKTLAGVSTVISKNLTMLKFYLPIVKNMISPCFAPKYICQMKPDRSELGLSSLTHVLLQPKTCFLNDPVNASAREYYSSSKIKHDETKWDVGQRWRVGHCLVKRTGDFGQMVNKGIFADNTNSFWYMEPNEQWNEFSHPKI